MVLLSCFAPTRLCGLSVPTEWIKMKEAGGKVATANVMLALTKARTAIFLLVLPVRL
jgi:hypothetical protein